MGEGALINKLEDFSDQFPNSKEDNYGARAQVLLFLVKIKLVEPQGLSSLIKRPASPLRDKLACALASSP